MARVAPRPSARTVLLDTGPLVAVLDSRDQWHGRCVAVWPEVIDHCMTTEAVITEASHLVVRGGGHASAPLDYVLAGGIPVVALDMRGLERVAELMRTYADVPMDFADGALVALAEGLGVTTVFTFDRRGFSTYRAQRRRRFAILPGVYR